MNALNLNIKDSDLQRNIFNKRAPSFDDLGWVLNRDFLGDILLSIQEFIKEYQKRGQNIKRYLDVGTGTGAVLHYLSEKYVNTQNILNGAEGIGIDVSDKMIQIAKEKMNGNQNVKIKEASIYTHDFEYESFDFIVCRNAFHHFTKPELALSEMKKLLHPGGRIFLIEGVAPTNETLERWKPILLLRDKGRNPQVLLSLENVENIFKTKFGMPLIKIKKLTPVPIVLSNWIDNALLAIEDTVKRNDTKQEIIFLVGRLFKKQWFREQFSIIQRKKEPKWEKDFQILKMSVLIEIQK